MQDQNDRLVVVETVSSVCWFLMDASWMLALPLAAKILAALTIATSLLIFRYTERSFSNMLVTAAMAAWASMNVCWMLHDLKSLEWGLSAAQVFFAAGGVCLVGALLAARGSREAFEAILTRFRRLRIGRGEKTADKP